MKFEFIAAKKVAFPVAAMCEVLGVSRERLLRVEGAAAGAETLPKTRGSASRSSRRTSEAAAPTAARACTASCAHKGVPRRARSGSSD